MFFLPSQVCAMITIDRTDVRFCNGCQTTRPIEEFRLFRKGGSQRTTQCNVCHRIAERERRRHQRALAERAEFRKHLTRINRAQPDELNELCAGILTRFGGVEGVMARLVSAHDSAKPGSPAKVRCALTMLKVVQASADAEQKRMKRFEEDVSRMSDEELEQAMKERLRAMVEGDPSLAIEAAVEVGWRVVPPTQEVAET